MKLKDRIMQTQNMQQSFKQKKDQHIKLKRIVQLGHYSTIQVTNQPYKKQDPQFNKQLMQLEKQNYRLIQSNFKLINQSIEILCQIKQQLLKVALYLTQSHYVDATKLVYHVISKVQNFRDSHKCPALSSSSKIKESKPYNNPQSSKNIKKITNFILSNQLNLVYDPVQQRKIEKQNMDRQYNSIYSQNQQQDRQRVGFPFQQQNPHWRTFSNSKNSLSFSNSNHKEQLEQSKHRYKQSKFKFKKNDENKSQIQDLYKFLLCQSHVIEEYIKEQ